MEPRFGYDFSRVRVHSTGNAPQSAESLNAHAYTFGQDIVFADGRYSPDTGPGRQLLAHELAHVVQQQHGAARVQRKAAGEPLPESGSSAKPGTAAPQPKLPPAIASKAPGLKDSTNFLGQKIPITPGLLRLLTGDKESTGDLLKLDKSTLPPDQKTEFKEIQGTAFVKGDSDTDEVDPNDVTQGKLGDCYLCAAMIAVARARPERIKQMIKKKSDGTYDVTLQTGTFWLSPEVINVDSTFPTIAGEPVYAGKGDISAKEGPELWGMLIEKAYAKSKGSYKAIVDGNAGEAVRTLTGGVGKTYNVEDYVPIAIAQKIDAALKDHKAVICNTAAMAEDETPEYSKERAKAGVVAHHSYLPIAVDVENETLDLQNPWGYKHLKNFPIDGPFKKYFSTINIVTT